MFRRVLQNLIYLVSVSGRFYRNRGFAVMVIGVKLA